MAITYGSGGEITVTMAGPFGSVGAAVRLTELILPAQGWKGGQSPYFQTVTPPGVSSLSKVDLLPSPQQLEQFRTLELAFTTENEGGQVTVYAIGSKPQFDLTFQASLTEVTA